MTSRLQPLPWVRPSFVVIVLVLLSLLSVQAFSPGAAAAGEHSDGGFTTNVTVASIVNAGMTISITARVSSTSTQRALVDVEVYAPDGRQVFQRFWDNRSFTAGRQRSFTASWAVPANAVGGGYAVKVGVFQPGWAGFWHWNDSAGSFTVTTAGAPTTTTATTTAPPPPTTAPPPPTTTVPAPTTATPPTTLPPPAGRFATLPPGSALPSSAECAARVRPAPEVRAVNAPYNATTGYSFTPDYWAATAELSRVDGNFTGTTDQILQWAACKWGIDEDVVRAQMAKESWWDQRNEGDWWSYPAEECPPGHAPGVDVRPGQCPQSLGIGQARFDAGNQAFPGVESSTAMNVDYTYAIWRACFEGKETWLNGVERGRQYGAGDLWGCVGRWFAGRWYTQPAQGYIADVQSYLSQRIWTTPDFLGY
ncbi:MAG: hypothetical protein ACR2HP_08985 [Ilumatobacteraceae bacterium]